MKQLFFVAVIMSIFLATSLPGLAQTSVSPIKMAKLQNKALPFIEGIELKQNTSNILVQSATAEKPYNNFSRDSIGINKKMASIKNLAHTENCSPLQFKYAQLINVAVEFINNVSLYNLIDEWWATRYHYGGTTKKGIDCSAFASIILHEIYNIVLPRTARDQYALCKKVDKENLTEGDLVFFNTRGGVSHVGVYLINNYFVHSSVHGGVTISSLNEKYYSRKYIGGGRML